MSRVLSVFLFVLLLLPFFTVPARANPLTAAMYVSPASQTVNVGATVSVDVDVADVVNTTCWQFTLDFSNAVLNCTSATEGPFLKSGGGTYFYKSINNANGYVLLSSALMGMNVQVSGSGVLATLTFKAIGSGQSALHMHDTVLGDTQIPPVDIPHSLSDGTVYVQAVQRKLTVTSAHDTPVPSAGDHYYNDGQSVTCSVTSPVTEGSTVWTCTGWSGTGSVPSSGSSTSVTFTISQTSTITWNWQGAPVQRKLTVSSAHDTPVPSVGDHYYNDGQSVTCSVTSPVTEGSTVWTCTGWSGTGSVPASGSGSSVTFTISQDSTITWSWQGAPVQRKLTVSSAHDSPSPPNGNSFYNDGASVTCRVTSSVTEGGITYVCTGWSGTGSVPASGSASSVTFTISQDSSITWNWAIVQRRLTVNSAHDSPNPSVGDHLYNDGSSVTCSVTSPVTEGSTVWTCTGWSGTGSVPPSGTGSSVTFTISQDSTITWSWQGAPVQRKLTVSSAHDSPNPSAGDHFYSDGGSVTCSVTSPVTEGGVTYVCTGWSGTGSVPTSGSGTSVTFTITQDSSITWAWSTVYYTLTVSSAHDSPNPSSGPHQYQSGSSVTCSVTSPVTEGSIVWTCTGWAGSGSVPSSGTGSSVTFTISQDSTITWSWQGAPVQRKLTVSSAHDSPSPPNGNNFCNDGTSVTCSVTSPVTEGGVTYVCTGWSGTGSVPSSGTGSSVTFTIIQDSSITWNWALIQRTLTVNSAHDTPSPSNGDHYYSDGQSVTCSVTSPVTEGSTVWTCTGWSGTGSVPSSGSGKTVPFTISQDSTLTWSWQGAPVQRKLTVASARDSPNPSVGDHFYDDGSSVTCSVTSPVTEGGVAYVCSGWTGTGSVPSSGSGTSTGSFTISHDSSITWIWAVVQRKLTVTSAHDSPSPAVGDHLYDDGSSVTCTVTSPVTEGSTVWTCTGWSGSGSVPSSGSGTSVTFTISQTSTITWNWQGAPVQRRLTVSSAHDSPSPSVGDHLYDDGTSVTCSVASPVTEGSTVWTCTGWSGSGSVPSSGSGTSVTFTISQTSTITWSWQGTPVQRKLTVTSAHDTPVPSAGDHYYNDGQSVTCSVTSPVTEGSTLWTCTGWSGTGSVPASGSSSSVTFTISQDSAIAWSWQGAPVQRKLTVSSAHDSPSPPNGNNFCNDGTSVTCSVTSPVTEGGVTYVCTGWSGTGSVPTSGSGTSVTFTITQDSSITWAWSTVYYTLTVSSAHDSPNPSSGPHQYQSGSSVTCSVTSPVTEGSIVWTCTGWAGSGSVPASGSGSSTGSFIISQDSVIAWSWQGAPVQRKLTVSSTHDSPSPSVGDHYYDDGTSGTCSVTSPVTEGGVTYACSGWSGTGSVPSSGSGTSTGPFAITQDSSITWSWAPVPRKLTVTSAHDSPNPGNGDHSYSDGSSVTCSVTSPVTEGSTVWTCTGWVGSGSVPLSGTASSVTFTISQVSTITWNWQGAPVQRTLTVSSAHDSPSPPNGDSFYNDGVSVTCSVTSPMTEGGITYVCTGWSGTGSVPSSGTGTSTGSFTLSQNSSITWNWAFVQRKLTVNSAHDSPNPSVGDHLYDDGSSVTCSVTSPVTEGSTVWTCTGWTGSGSVPASGSGKTVTFTISQNSSISWSWQGALVQCTLTITVNGQGSVSRNPDQATYTYGTNVTLAATANVGWSFNGWSGDASGTTNPITLNMTGNKAVTATFTQNTYTLTVNLVGSGSVNRNNTGPYHYGDIVQLTGVPATGWSFQSWSGDASGTSNPTTVTMTGNRAVTATFTQNHYTLTVNVAGSGSVGKNPDLATYTHGTDVTLTATAQPGWVFSSWNGDQIGSANPVTLTMNGNKVVTATFTEVGAGVHDVAITNVTTSKQGCLPLPSVCRGYTSSIFITVENRGNFTETINVHAYVNSTTGEFPVGTSNVTLNSGDSAVITLAWNTSGLVTGNYTVHALTGSVPGETNISNNMLYDGTILVTIVGDITGPAGRPDGKVDMFDVGSIARKFMAMPPSPDYTKNYDLNDDGIINMADIATVARHFMEHEP